MTRWPFVDAHVHFWDHAVEGLEWDWLVPGFEHPRLKGMHRLDAPRYTVPEFRAESDGCNVVKIVHIQSATVVEGLERETAWMQSLSDSTGWPDAIVGGARLKRRDIAELLARHAQHPNFRGIRDTTIGPDLEHPDIERGYAALAHAGALFELMVSWERFDAAIALARRHPSVQLVVGHAGLPIERSDAYFTQWLPAMRRLAGLEGSVCKISALASGADPEWSVASIRPWMLGCIDAFGVDRCMFATNWPIDRLYGTYERLVDAYHEIVADFTADEQRALFAGTAERVYRI